MPGLTRAVPPGGSFRVNIRWVPWETAGIKSYGSVYAGKIDLLVQISIYLFLKSYGESYDEFSEPSFPHNLAKNTICAQNEGLNWFFDEIMAVLVLPDHFTILTAFS
jgi:hypothetical protein